MSRLRVAAAWSAAVAFALAAVFVVPIGMQAEKLLVLANEDDPVAIADQALTTSFDAPIAIREMEAALAAKDADLAKSFLDLAGERGLNVPSELAAQVNQAVESAASARAQLESFGRGLIVGEPDNVVGLAGTTLGDLLVFGDIRDAVREGTRYVSGQKVDEFVLGLSLVGIAITAGTYASFGAGTPARVGLSAVKVACKTGRISARMADWIGRSLREAVDWPALRRAGGSLAQPVSAVRVGRAAVKAGKADGLMKLAGDLGRVQSRAGTQGALDALKLAENPRDVARIAKLAEKKGSKTRAILKILGRGAIVLSVASWNLATSIFGAILTVLGFIAAAKSGVERLTQRMIDRRKKRARARSLALIEARA
ncbi:MAG: hypothetical protein QOD74_2162 [Variibacter sp.]|nr:hypothetical protein [Variibacter sp.]